MIRSAKRSGAAATALALALVAGCSNGIKEGMPEDAAAGKAPEKLTDQMKQFAQSQKGKKHAFTPPPLGPLPGRR